MSDLKIIARREVKETLRRPIFWISTLVFPLFMAAILFLNNASEKALAQKAEQQLKEATKIILVDKAGVIDPATVSDKVFEFSDNAASAKQAVVDGQADATFIYQTDIAKTGKVQVIENQTSDGNPLNIGRYNDLAVNLVQQSAFNSIPDPLSRQLANETLQTDTTTYHNGQPAKQLGDYLAPALVLGAYFLLLILTPNIFLMSVTEEKENRAMEMILTAVKLKDFILGKLSGLTLAAIAQILMLASISIVGFIIFGGNLPDGINFSLSSINWVQLALAVFYLLSGFIIIASLLIGVGSLATNAREAGNMVGPVIMLTIFPIYFITFILQDPSGGLALGTSYFPLTAPFILQVRNALGVIPTSEVIFSVITLATYTVAAVFLSLSMFKVGALDYNKRVSLKRLRNSLIKRK